MEENEEVEEEKKSIDIEFTKLIVDPENAENTIGFRLLNVQVEDEEDIANASIIESLQKQPDQENYPKNNSRIDWWLRYHT